MATRHEFEEAMTQDDACYVYYTDDEHNMHFVADEIYPSYTDSLTDAFLFHEVEAYTIKFLFDLVYSDVPIVHHIVKMKTQVEWM